MESDFELYNSKHDTINANVTPVASFVSDILSVDVEVDKKYELGGELDNPLVRSYNRWSPVEEGVTLAWRDVSVYAKVQGNQQFKKIISNVSGAVKPGNLVALMGSSGAGKSTLMSALAYRTPCGTTVEGDILINGRPIGDFMRNLSGFMHQDDLFVGSLTVLEHMNFMARLKLDRRTSIRDRKRKVESLLKTLGLWHCIHTRIGETGDAKVLSGGEKKRLAFAAEMLTNPPILFCDEPTTGLDSFSAQKLVHMMNLMASKGKTIICTIHQPSSELFAMFNQLILVADGRVAFVGTSEQALDFFKTNGYTCPENYNPADFFIHTLAITPGSEQTSRHAIKRICDQFAVSDAAREIDLVVQYEFHMGSSIDFSAYNSLTNYKKPFWWTVLFWLTYRCILQVIRNPAVQALRIIQKAAIALMVSLCYLGTVMTTQTGIQSIQGAIFLFVTENTFTPMYSVLALFPQELPLFLREYHSGLYNTGVYYVSKMIALFPGLVVEPALFVIICYWISGLRNTLYAFTMTILATILTMNVSTACGVFFSNAFESVPAAMSYLVPFDNVLMITSGVFIKISSLPSFLSWIKYLSWLMYSNEAMTIVQWEGITNITCEAPSPDIPCIFEGQEVLDKYSFSSSHLFDNYLAMIILYIIFHILGFLCLLRRAKRR